MEKAGDLLRMFLSGEQFENGRRWTAFFESWKKILGEKLAHHSRIRDVKNGAVIVEVDHPGWIQMLQMKQRPILSEIERLYPELHITSLHIQLSERKFWTGDPPADPPGKEEPQDPVSRPEDAAEPASAETHAEKREETDGAPAVPDAPLDGIRDDSFRELLERLEKSIRKRNRDSARRGPPGAGGEN